MSGQLTSTARSLSAPGRSKHNKKLHSSPCTTFCQNCERRKQEDLKLDEEGVRCRHNRCHSTREKFVSSNLAKHEKKKHKLCQPDCPICLGLPLPKRGSRRGTSGAGGGYGGGSGVKGTIFSGKGTGVSDIKPETVLTPGTINTMSISQITDVVQPADTIADLDDITTNTTTSTTTTSTTSTTSTTGWPRHLDNDHYSSIECKTPDDDLDSPPASSDPDSPPATNVRMEDYTGEEDEEEDETVVEATVEEDESDEEIEEDHELLMTTGANMASHRRWQKLFVGCDVEAKTDADTPDRFAWYEGILFRKENFPFCIVQYNQERYCTRLVEFESLHIKRIRPVSNCLLQVSEARYMLKVMVFYNLRYYSGKLIDLNLKWNRIPLESVTVNIRDLNVIFRASWNCVYKLPP
ncbi:hypothetical protein SAMD00019534_123650 [Acytostelium subglobosum LB1]|uniref:hypothetical protein n=1 Tax=Acytostelium subglobosum LB1 TaxID=1410327 RepID=UPI0006449705|nr:hypothetical protein SAMD00019534_123650 [Acytostelium subglobosum LB1]GAM29189.1 hypothetical protein SAMD00019534_123650 [Acytostelium subglobosum LB1]|eukprot:XP_012747880.1 hypothetical protein SAMD00019534_123650 [Acytostelium subglobosum LB1]